MIPGFKRHHLLRQAAAITAAAVLVLVSGCSMLRVGYTQLDHYAAWKADDYFELEPQQKEQFMARFQRLHRWHRYEELPRYADALVRTRNRFEKGLEAKDLLWLIDEAKAGYRSIVQRSASDAAALLLTITPAQLDAVKRQWARDNARFVREHALNGTPQERRRASLKRNLERVRHWTGSLSADQEARIAAMLDAIPEIDRMRYEDRRRRQREFLALMQDRSDPARFTERLREWLLGWEQGRDPAYDERLAQVAERRAQMVAEIARTLAPAQRANVIERLQGYIEDFRALSETGDVRSAGR